MVTWHCIDLTSHIESYLPSIMNTMLAGSAVFWDHIASICCMSLWGNYWYCISWTHYFCACGSRCQVERTWYTGVGTLMAGRYKHYISCRSETITHTPIVYKQRSPSNSQIGRWLKKYNYIGIGSCPTWVLPHGHSTYIMFMLMNVQIEHNRKCCQILSIIIFLIS